MTTRGLAAIAARTAAGMSTKRGTAVSAVVLTCAPLQGGHVEVPKPELYPDFAVACARGGGTFVSPRARRRNPGSRTRGATVRNIGTRSDAMRHERSDTGGSPETEITCPAKERIT